MAPVPNAGQDNVIYFQHIFKLEKILPDMFVYFLNKYTEIPLDHD